MSQPPVTVQFPEIPQQAWWDAHAYVFFPLLVGLGVGVFIGGIVYNWARYFGADKFVAQQFGLLAAVLSGVFTAHYFWLPL
jgi:hypothetical protein